MHNELNMCIVKMVITMCSHKQNVWRNKKRRNAANQVFNASTKY